MEKIKKIVSSIGIDVASTFIVVIIVFYAQDYLPEGIFDPSSPEPKISEFVTSPNLVIPHNGEVHYLDPINFV